MEKIKIKIGKLEIPAELNDTKIAKMIWENLPIKAKAETWGEEIYFSIPVFEQNLEDPKEVVQAGDLGYWPPGNAFCIFFGATPMSSEDKIRPASAVEVIGRFHGGTDFLKQVSDGRTVTIKRAN